jgi:hypothetical protein
VASIAIIFRRNGKVGAFKLNMIRMSKKDITLFYFILFLLFSKERERERERERGIIHCNLFWLLEWLEIVFFMECMCIGSALCKVCWYFNKNLYLCKYILPFSQIMYHSLLTSLLFSIFLLSKFGELFKKFGEI